MALALAEAFLDARREVVGIRIQVSNLRNASAVGNTNAGRFTKLAMQLAQSKVFLATIESVGGIAQYARDQLNDPSYNVVARFNDVQSELTVLIDWVMANYPLSAGGFQETFSFNVDGTSSERQFSAGQTTGFVTAADSFVAAADAFLT